MRLIPGKVSRAANDVACWLLLVDRYARGTAKPKGHQLMPNLEQRQGIESNILGDGGDLEIDVELFADGWRASR